MSRILSWIHATNNSAQVLSTFALTMLVPELLTSGLLAYTIGPLGVRGGPTTHWGVVDMRPGKRDD